MAESIIIHCRESDRSELVRRIKARFGHVSESMWRFPVDDHLASVTPYDEFESEYEPTKREDVIARFGVWSIPSFDFETHRSRSDEACDLLEDFVRLDCVGVGAVVDDVFRILSIRDLTEADDFLDIYRYEKQKQHKSLVETAGNAASSLRSGRP